MDRSAAVFLQDILFSTASLVALTNPVAELAVFLRIVDGWPRKEVRRAAMHTAGGVWLILTFSAVAGLQILRLLGISLAAFQAAGALLLILMGMEMLQGREPVTQYESARVDDPAEALWVPLVMPMLAGPGAIAATVSLGAESPRSLARSRLPRS